MKRKRISNIIAQLQREMAKHGDLFVYYASDYDWATPVRFATAETDPGWEDAPKEKALYLN